MQIDVSHGEHATTIILNGSFDAAASREARELFNSLLAQGKKEFIVDLAGVDFIDSSGLGALVGFFKKVRVGEGDLKLSKPRESIQKILELTHLDKVFAIIPNEGVAAAL